MKEVFQFQSSRKYISGAKTGSTSIIQVIALGFCFIFFFQYNAMAQTSHYGIAGSSENHNKLWYLEPASDWMEALPIGNGKIGAMVFGGVEQEKLQLNEESVWAGPPIPENRVGAYKSIEKARALIFQGDYAEANKLVQDDVMGPRIAPRSYQPLGDLLLNFKLQGAPSNYRRELDINDALAKTSFTAEGVNYSREYFSSAIDDAIVVVLTADKRNSISLELEMKRKADFEVANIGNNRLKMWGQASQKGKHLGVKYETQVMVLPKGGDIKSENGTISINNANSVVLFISAATDYNAGDPFSPLTQNLSTVCATKLKKAAKKSLKKLKEDHIADYQNYFNRVALDLGGIRGGERPTNERLEAVANGADDPGLMALYFQYGRYLLISSSRPGSLPANLQGIWNDHLAAPWNSDYHTNINMQMNYWPAEVANLSECHEPFFDFIERLVPAGKKTAEEVYNSDGIVVHHTTDVWHWTSPIGKVQYGMWPMGGAWCTRHFMEHYKFNGDTEFLKERAYPIMRESAKFLLDWLTKDPRSGMLVSGPSTSPENKFYTPKDPEVFANLDMGNAMDQEIIWDNFTNVLEAAEILKIEGEFVERVKEALAQLSLPKIGSDGRLMEWSQEFGEVDKGHRHLSHLYGLYPGNQFTENKTPYYIDAINRSIEHRLSNGGGHTGWSRAWIINFYARLGNSEKAYENIKALLAKSTAKNLFDYHPPFQIDGNFGGTAGIAEMLMQSHETDASGTTIINLLPALPSEWPTGSVSGLKARGGFEVDIVWNNGALESVSILSKEDKACKLQIGDSIMGVEVSAGNKQAITEFK
ncbi:glycoside hydrolase N-terminal domain-containing protein [Arenibacter sp. ARW7G5Y1]|uniref:glycoside hydrolase family 95 protein n=1 Tax=Arenibacter sp. ARW7G5Y1 TaxID=2135619 RepID=UPI000D76F5CD|nr:glycoside hydrolase family 95 protein [Arenibacter sp. ARW7G5Y1]PXX25400.1 alpha-L-fucosidase 2 [Arenibacter sp. ARW7G5Y1]